MSAERPFEVLPDNRLEPYLEHARSERAEWQKSINHHEVGLHRATRQEKRWADDEAAILAEMDRRDIPADVEPISRDSQ